MVVGAGLGRRRARALVAVAMVGSILWSVAGEHGRAAPRAVRMSGGRIRAKPNIVLILTDDQRWDTLSWMPTVQRELVAHGVTFANAFVSNPQCCPSRVSILTG